MARSSPQLTPTFVDLFSGCGGIAKGFQKAGFVLRGAVEIDRDAVETYRMNVDGDIHEADIADITDWPTVDVLVGGPPSPGLQPVRHPQSIGPAESAVDGVCKGFWRDARFLDMPPIWAWLPRKPASNARNLDPNRFSNRFGAALARPAAARTSRAKLRSERALRKLCPHSRLTRRAVPVCKR